MYSVKQVLGALLLTCFLTTLLTWIALGSCAVIVALGALVVSADSMPIDKHTYAASLLMVLPVTFLSSVLGLALSVFFPKLADARIGNGSVLEMVAIGPALAALMVITLVPSVNPLAMTTIVSVLALSLAAIVLAVISKVFDPALILENV
jgi:hypothetical protein